MGNKTAAAINLVRIVAEAIKEAGLEGIPSGHLYTVLAGHIPLHAYQSLVTALVGAGLVKQTGHLLTWIGKENQT